MSKECEQEICQWIRTPGIPAHSYIIGPWKALDLKNFASFDCRYCSCWSAIAHNRTVLLSGRLVKDDALSLTKVLFLFFHLMNMTLPIRSIISTCKGSLSKFGALGTYVLVLVTIAKVIKYEARTYLRSARDVPSLGRMSPKNKL